MQLKQLLYLKTVGETKSIRKASNELFVSQQAISQSLLNFETEYNVQLLNRNVHGVSLTELGKYVVEEAEKILTLTNALEKHLIEYTEQQYEDTLRIAAIRTFKDYILPEARIKFIKTYPDVTLKISTMDTTQVLHALEKKEANIGFLGVPYIDGIAQVALPEKVSFFPLKKYPFCVAVGDGSPLINLQSVSIKSILKYPIVFLEEQLTDGLDNYWPYTILKNYGKINAEIADSERYYRELINSNLAIGITTNQKFDGVELTNKLIPLRDNVYTELGYLLHEENTSPILSQKFLSFIPTTMLQTYF